MNMIKVNNHKHPMGHRHPRHQGHPFADFDRLLKERSG